MNRTTIAACTSNRHGVEEIVIEYQRTWWDKFRGRPMKRVFMRVDGNDWAEIKPVNGQIHLALSDLYDSIIKGSRLHLWAVERFG